MNRNLAACLVLALSACAGSRSLRLSPLETEGEVYLYLDELSPEAGRLAFSIESVAALGTDGRATPLRLSLPEVSVRTAVGQRLLAWGRLPPGSYAGILLAVRKATLAGDGRPAGLAVGPEPARIDAPFTAVERRATVLSLSLQYERSVTGGFAFAPVLSVSTPRPAVPSLVGYCTNTGSNSLTVFDKHTRRVVAVIPTGREPEGLAIDPLRPRAYVALAGEDQIAVLDVAVGEEIGRIPLRPGDRPRDLAVTPDGRTLVVTNAGSNSASFLDPIAGLELERVQTGEEPGTLLLDASGGRAYVLNRRSSSITALDLANRAVAATVATEAEPISARINRAGTRLYVAQAGSTRLAVHALPDLSVQTRVNVGLGASALLVDPRTDQVYVGRRDDERLQVIDPLSLQPMRQLDLGGPAVFLAFDPVEMALFALEPGRRSVEAVDLVSGRALAAFEVGEEPYRIALAGERR